MVLLFAVATFCTSSSESVLNAPDVQYLQDVAKNEDHLNVKVINTFCRCFLQSELSIFDLDFHMA
jgi:hypothetical protein